MVDWIRVCDPHSVPEGSGIACRVNDFEAAVFRINGEWFVVEGRCPHQGASLADGALNGAEVTCPLHGWRFDLRSGLCANRPGPSVRSLPVKVDDHGVWVQQTWQLTTDQSSEPDGIQRLLVRYGAPGWVGLFGTVNHVDCRHRDRVLVHTDRGVEIGEVLADPVLNGLPHQKPTGEVLRLPDVAELEAHAERQLRIPRLIVKANALAREKQLALEVLDGELLFEGTIAVLYYLGEFNAAIAEIRTQLALDHELERVDFHPLVEQTAGGCGMPGCGGGAGGCGSHTATG